MAKVVHAAGGVERRYPKPPYPQASQFERVAPAAIIQRTPTDSTAADERHLHLVDVDTARRFRRSRGLGECAGRENAAQDHQAHSNPSGDSRPHLATESTEHWRSPFGLKAFLYYF